MIHRNHKSGAPSNGQRALPRLGDHFVALAQRLDVEFQAEGELPRAVGVTSWLSGAGVSTIALNLARGAAWSGTRKVLLVDAHLERPSIGSFLRMKPHAGVAEWMLGAASIEDAILPTADENLFVLLAGFAAHDRSVGHDLARWSDLFDELKQHFSLVVVDLPPAHELSPGLVLASLLDGVVFVVDARRGHRDDGLRSRQQLLAAKARLLGVVLNKR